jgi:hypothetical protein
MFLNAILSQFYLPAEAPLIPRLVPEKLLLAANSIFSFTFFTSMGIGFILAGPVLKYTGDYGGFMVLTIMYLIATWSVLQIPYQNEKVITLTYALKRNMWYVASRIVKDLKSGFSFVFHARPIADALGLLSGTQIVLALLGSLGPGFADRILHIEVTDASMVILAPAIVGIIFGALWVGNYGSRFKTESLIRLGLLASGILLILVSVFVMVEQRQVLSQIPGMVLILSSFSLFFFLGVSNSFLDVPSNATLQRETTGEMRGKIYGMLTSVSGGIGILPVVLGGVLADTIGIGRVLATVGASILVIGLFRNRSK